MQWPILPIKNLTSLFPLIFLSKHISLHALGRLKWVLDIIWPLNQHFKLKNQKNWIKQVFMLSFLIVIIWILLHRPKKLTLKTKYYVVVSKINHQFYIFERKLTIRGIKCFYFVLEIANNAIDLFLLLLVWLFSIFSLT